MMLDGTTGTYGCTNFNTQRRPLRTGTSMVAWWPMMFFSCRMVLGRLNTLPHARYPQIYFKCSLKRKTCRYQTIGLNSGTLRCIVNSKRSIQGTERMCSIMGIQLSSLAHIDSVALLLGQSSSQMAHDTLACFVQDFDSIRI